MRRRGGTGLEATGSSNQTPAIKSLGSFRQSMITHPQLPGWNMGIKTWTDPAVLLQRITEIA